MKFKYSAIAEMQEAPQQFINQLSDIQKWVSHWTHRLYAVQTALEYEVVSLEEMPDKIASLRASLYEIDKSLEILSVNCLSVAQTQTKESNDQTRNGTSDKQVSGEFDK
jgi:hypothetical protein